MAIVSVLLTACVALASGSCASAAPTTRTGGHTASTFESLGESILRATAEVDASRPGKPVNEELVGFDGPGSPSTVPSIAALRPAYIRTDVSFEATIGSAPVYDCSTGAWNPRPLDQRVAEIRREHARALLIVDYMPGCLATDAPEGKAASWPRPRSPHS